MSCFYSPLLLTCGSWSQSHSVQITYREGLTGRLSNLNMKAGWRNDESDPRKQNWSMQKQHRPEIMRNSREEMHPRLLVSNFRPPDLHIPSMKMARKSFGWKISMFVRTMDDRCIVPRVASLKQIDLITIATLIVACASSITSVPGLVGLCQRPHINFSFNSWFTRPSLLAFAWLCSQFSLLNIALTWVNSRFLRISPNIDVMSPDWKSERPVGCRTWVVSWSGCVP